jgi:hypothetical protein
MIQKVDLIKLCCGRYVSQSQVASLFNEQGQSYMPDVVVGHEDLPATVTPHSSIDDLFTFSPFGLNCRQCKKGAMIQMDERSISEHLKKHCMDNSISIVRSILEYFSKQVNNAKASGTIEPVPK